MADEALAGTAVEDTATAGDGGPTEEQLRERLKESLRVQTEKLGSLRVKMTITVPREILDERLGKQFTELRKEAVVPGFRKGRAPVKLIEKRFGQDVGDEIVGQLVGASFLLATEREGLKSIGDPLVWINAPPRQTDARAAHHDRAPIDRLMTLEEALDHLHMPTTGDLTYRCEVELRPEVTLPTLEGIPVKRPKIEITDEDVANEITGIRARNGYWSPVEDGVVAADDMIYGSIKIAHGERTLLEEEGVPLPVRGIVYRGFKLEAMGTQLVGKKAGDSVRFSATVNDDYEEMELRGKEASVDLSVQEVKRMALPDMDANFFASLGCADEAELKQIVRGELEARLGEAMQKALRGQIMKYLIDNTPMELPPDLSQRQIERAVLRRMVETYWEGMPQDAIAKEMDRLRAETAEHAIADLKFYFIAEKIAEDNKVEVTDEEFNGAIAQIARRRRQRFDRTRDELAKDNGLDALYMQLRDRKIVDQLLEKANIEETPGPAKP